MPNSSNAGSSGRTAKAKKAKENAKRAKEEAREAKKAELLRRRANAASIRNNVTARFGRGKLAAQDRERIEKKLKRIRENEDKDTAQREAEEASYYRRVNALIAERDAEKAAEKAAKNAEKAAAREAAKSARSAATTARREQKDRNLAKAKANLKNYLGESPLKKHINALYKARKNKAGMTAKNYAKAAGLHRTRKLTESAKKLQKKQKSVMADFEAKGVEPEKFCETAKAYVDFKNYLETTHKEAELKHSLATIIDVCNKPVVKTPESSASASASE